MKLHYLPGACSLAAHIVAREAGLNVEALKAAFGKDRATADGRDYYAVNPVGAVPALELDNGEVLTENAVVLQYLAEQAPAANLGPPASGMARWRFLETLNFIATELHKNIGSLYAQPPQEFKAMLAAKAEGRLKMLDKKLGAGPYLDGARFSILDAYAFTMLSWAKKFEIPFSDNLHAYFDRVKTRPGAAKALAEEGLSY